MKQISNFQKILALFCDLTCFDKIGGEAKVGLKNELSVGLGIGLGIKFGVEKG